MGALAVGRPWPSCLTAVSQQFLSSRSGTETTQATHTPWATFPTRRASVRTTPSRPFQFLQRTAPLLPRGGAGGVEDRGLSRVGRAWQARGRRARVTCSPPAHTLRRTGTPSCSLVALGSSSSSHTEENSPQPTRFRPF